MGEGRVGEGSAEMGLGRTQMGLGAEMWTEMGAEGGRDGEGTEMREWGQRQGRNREVPAGSRRDGLVSWKEAPGPCAPRHW